MADGVCAQGSPAAEGCRPRPACRICSGPAWERSRQWAGLLWGGPFPCSLETRTGGAACVQTQACAFDGLGHLPVAEEGSGAAGRWGEDEVRHPRLGRVRPSVSGCGDCAPRGASRSAGWVLMVWTICIPVAWGLLVRQAVSLIGGSPALLTERTTLLPVVTWVLRLCRGRS